MAEASDSTRTPSEKCALSPERTQIAQTAQRYWACGTNPGLDDEAYAAERDTAGDAFRLLTEIQTGDPCDIARKVEVALAEYAVIVGSEMAPAEAAHQAMLVSVLCDLRRAAASRSQPIEARHRAAKLKPDPHPEWQAGIAELHRLASIKGAEDQDEEAERLHEEAASIQWRIETTPAMTMAGVAEQVRSVFHLMQSSVPGEQQRLALELAVMTLDRLAREAAHG
jgi:hypothetical protein